ncbi:hypothetical protein HY485_01885 [Candidatus Woesearchaeota archaeon]|nr:hypothetical protein [Candidatus Woesearchaeota archaeon]
MSELYTLEGFYAYGDFQGRLTGKLNLRENNSFDGDITDHLSVVPEQRIKGSFVFQSDKTIMVFTKFPPRTNLANLLYELTKENAKPKLTGKYIGTWNALPFKIDVEQSGLMIAAIDTTVCGIQDYTELTIEKE